jgi:hypothetical protein
MIVTGPLMVLGVLAVVYGGNRLWRRRRSPGNS